VNTGDVGILGLGAVFGVVGWLLFGPLGAVPAFLVGAWVGGRLATLSEQVESLEARVVELEANESKTELALSRDERAKLGTGREGLEPRSLTPFAP
jgi:hypothetical protein